MGRECGEDRKEMLIKESGGSENLRVMEFILGQMEIAIRESLRNV
jgi:hypothetical protein